MTNYYIDIFEYNRRKSKNVEVGSVIIGGDNDIVIQSMTTSNTNDTKESADQIMKIADAGGEIVRLTTQGPKEAANLKNIKQELCTYNRDVPLVADIHFNPKAAIEAAKNVEKVRINPGNYADGAKKFNTLEYTQEEYANELANVEEKLLPLLNICKENNTALRIGTNHGSLSDRIMSQFGDTPKGMVESCMEYIRICKKHDFNDIVLSIKASNPLVMIHTVRMLVQQMHEENMDYPLHLGVTEAGEGSDGRIISAVGIATLLIDGIGDTIRVSLTEDPKFEIPVAKRIIEHVEKRKNHEPIRRVSAHNYNPFKYKKRKSHQVGIVGGNILPVLVGKLNTKKNTPDFVLSTDVNKLDNTTNNLVNINDYKRLKDVKMNTFAIVSKDELNLIEDENKAFFLRLTTDDIDEEMLKILQETDNAVLLLSSTNANTVADLRAVFLELQNRKITNPVIIEHSYDKFDKDHLIDASCDFGPLLIDGFGDGIFINSDQNQELINSAGFSILQATRARITKPDFISCPGCGRTLFDLQNTTSLVKSKTEHLHGLKIAVMGCIVNGPGEMADADYGYVGSGPGKITLYHKQEVVKRNINQDNAIDELVKLLKQNEDWREPVE